MHVLFIPLIVIALFSTGCTPRTDTSLKNREVLVSNYLSFESYKEFSQIIKSNSVDTVVFKDCLGGNAYVGLQYAKAIRAYKLNTIASGFVASACADAFLGGKSRGLDKNAPWNTLMFHGSFNMKTKESAGVQLNQLVLDEIFRELSFSFSSQVNEIILNTTKEEEGIYFFRNDKGVNLIMYCDGNQGSDYSKCKKLNGISLESEKIIF